MALGKPGSVKLHDSESLFIILKVCILKLFTLFWIVLSWISQIFPFRVSGIWGGRKEGLYSKF